VVEPAHAAEQHPAAHGAEQQHAAQAAAKPAQAAQVAPPPQSVVKTAAVAWAKAHNFPVREIEVGPPERRVTRLFVPVTAESWPSFVETFSSGPNRLMMKLIGGDNHLLPVLDGQSYIWGRSARALGPYYEGRYGMAHRANDGPNGPAMILDLGESESQHVRQWFTHRAEPNDALWGQACGHACMDYIGNVEVAPGADGTHTLRTIPKPEIDQAAAGGNNVKGGTSTKVPMGQKLFDVLGIARSKDGRNMTYNMIHAANEKVQVVGIPVGADAGGGQTEKRVIRENGRVFVREVKLTGAAVERFNKMTDAELLGPLPPQGVAGVARPVK
jgi:hypothetical protein